MTNVELLNDLKEFYSMCVRAGWCRITRFQDITQLWIPVHGKMGRDGLKHSFKLIPMNLRYLHWVDPHTSGKMVRAIDEILTYLDKAYVSVRMIADGTQYLVEAFDINGQRKKKWVLKLFFFPPLHVLLLDTFQRLIRWFKNKGQREAEHKEEKLTPNKMIGKDM